MVVVVEVEVEMERGEGFLLMERTRGVVFVLDSRCPSCTYRFVAGSPLPLS